MQPGFVFDGEITPLFAAICTLPPDEGPCRAIIPRWAYNPDTERCESFRYGGCGGNENNFETRDECAATCAAERKSFVVYQFSFRQELHISGTHQSVFVVTVVCWLQPVSIPIVGFRIVTGAPRTDGVLLAGPA